MQNERDGVREEEEEEEDDDDDDTLALHSLISFPFAVFARSILYR